MSFEQMQNLSGMGERISSNQIFYSIPDYINYLKHHKAYQHACGLVQGKTVLDLGCGSGFGTSQLAEYASAVTGMDISDEVILLLNNENTKENLKYVSFAGKKLPFESQSLDVVVSLQVIEHVEDVPLYLQEIHRVLCPGGKAMFTTPNRRIRLLPLQRPWNPYHLREYNFEQLATALQRVFHQVIGFSLKAEDEITNIDLARTRQKPLLVYFLNPLKHIIKTMIGRKDTSSTEAAGKPISDDEKSRFRPEQFSYTEENDPLSLDLMFVVQK